MHKSVVKHPNRQHLLCSLGLYIDNWWPYTQENGHCLCPNDKSHLGRTTFLDQTIRDRTRLDQYGTSLHSVSLLNSWLFFVYSINFCLHRKLWNFVHLAKLGVLSSNNPGGHGHPASIVLRQRAPSDHRCLFVFVLFLYICVTLLGLCLIILVIVNCTHDHHHYHHQSHASHLPGWFAKKGGSARGPEATFLDNIRKSGNTKWRGGGWKQL